MEERLNPLLQMLFGAMNAGFFTIWAKGKDGAKITHWYDLAAGSTALQQAAQKALELDAQGYDVYFSTCPARTRGTASKRITQDKVCAIPAFFIDCDVGKKNCPASKDELREKLLALLVPPRVIADSGNGYHAYWPLAVPMSIINKQELDQAKMQLRGFADGMADQLGYTGFDLSASEPARVLRVPGTHNHKTETPVPVDVIHLSDLPSYSMDELAPYVIHTAKTVAPPPPAPPKEPASLNDWQILAKMRTGRHGERLSRLWNGQWETDYKSQSEADIALLNSLAFYTQGDAARMDDLFRQSGLYRAEKWDQMHGTQTYAQMSIHKALDTTTTFYDPQYKKNREDGAPPAENPTFARFTRAYELVGGYVSSKGTLLAESIDQNGEITTKPLANFTALITDETTKDDGVETRKEFALDGVTATGKQLPTVSVPTNRFASMAWVLDGWGADANIFPGSTIKDKVRYAIQAASAPLLKRSTVYTHAGWRSINRKTAYLYHGGAVGIDGISVEPGGSLSIV